jgi:signal transduction histidine kinase
VFQLAGGFRLLVGRDLEERERLHDIVLAAGQWSVALVIVLGLAGGFFVARRVLRRIDAMTETSRTIMAGDLSGRLPVGAANDELDRLGVNLNAMLERIEALMKGFKEVSDNIAHDLKTPLTRLRNRAEEALRGGRDQADYRAALEATIEESDELIRTFNALLMIARVESGQASRMTDFDAAEVVNGVAELYDPLAEENGLSLNIDVPGPMTVHGNRELLTQALANLIDNAIKYSADEKRLEVVLRQTAEHVIIEVKDHGIGIEPKDVSRIFDPYYRAKFSDTTTRRGAGLGLTLVQQIVSSHDGQVELDSTPGVGSTFRLMFPRSLESAAPDDVPTMIHARQAF